MISERLIIVNDFETDSHEADLNREQEENNIDLLFIDSISGSKVEKRKSEIKERLSELIKSPERPIGKLIWKEAIKQTKSLVERKKQVEYKINKENLPQITEILANRIAEKILLPFLKLLLQKKEKERLSKFQALYKKYHKL